MKVHFTGICGTGMGQLALLFQAKGFDVRGSDAAFYPPISDLLNDAGIPCMETYREENLSWKPDLVVIGNVIRKDNPEALFAENQDIPRFSMSSALRTYFLEGRRAVVVSGTHGKTTSSSMFTHLLKEAGLEPGFFIGGVPHNLGTGGAIGRLKPNLIGGPSTSTSKSPFVIEGDEYDAVFWHKKPKFLDYIGVSNQDIVLLTSVEHDHIDIYASKELYEEAFAELLNRIPAEGLLVCDASTEAVRRLVRTHAKCHVAYTSLEGDDTGEATSTWHAALAGTTAEGNPQFDVYAGGVLAGRFALSIPGKHNVRNALMCIAAAAEGFHVPFSSLKRSLLSFQGVKRRQELLGSPKQISVYDDFAHHPTAVDETLKALRLKHPEGNLWAVFEPRSATACRNLHQNDYVPAFQTATQVIFPPLGRSNIAKEEALDLEKLCQDLGPKARLLNDVETIVHTLSSEAKPGDVIAILSNGAFGGIHQKVLRALAKE